MRITHFTFWAIFIITESPEIFFSAPSTFLLQFFISIYSEKEKIIHLENLLCSEVNKYILHVPLRCSSQVGTSCFKNIFSISELQNLKQAKLVTWVSDTLWLDYSMLHISTYNHQETMKHAHLHCHSSSPDFPICK